MRHVTFFFSGYRNELDDDALAVLDTEIETEGLLGGRSEEHTSELQSR